MLSGSDDRRTVTAMLSLVNLYKNRGKLNEAEELYDQIPAEEEKQLGAEDSLTLVIFQLVAHLYEEQGIFDEAKKLYARVLAGEEKKLDTGHPSKSEKIH